MSLRVLLPRKDHRDAIYDLLNSQIYRLHIFALHVYDTHITTSLMLSRILQELLSAQKKVIIVAGEHPDRIRDPKLRLEVLDFLRDLWERGARVYIKDGLHAKLIRGEGDRTHIIITSANISQGGLHGNDELGVYLIDGDAETETVKRFIHDVLSGKWIALEEIIGGQDVV